MSKMLEEAIVDARALREAAVKDAENMVVEKYSDEVRLAVQGILEQDEMPEDELSLGLGDEEMAPEEESSVMADIPMAHSPEGEDDVVIIDLDQIIAAAEADEDVEDQEFELDAEEIADNVGIPMGPDMDMEEPAVANRDDEELDLDEDQLVDMFKEMLVVDVNPADIEESQETEDEKKSENKEEEEVYVSSPRTDGMDTKDIEDHTRMTAKLESRTKENNELKDILVKVKDRLEEVNLSNARLLYANRVLQDTSLNEQQKNKIVEIVSGSRTVEEAKMVYETLQKTMANTKSGAPQSLSEAVSRRSSVILAGRSNSNNRTETTENNPVTNRWATLAGINNKN